MSAKAPARLSAPPPRGGGGGFIGGIESLLAWLSTTMRQSAYDYCDLETAENETTLVARDGSLVTVIRVDGVSSILGEDDFNDKVDNLTTSLQSYMSGGGHMMQFYVVRDGDHAVRVIQEALRPSRVTAKVLQLDVEDIFLEKERHLSKRCAFEEVYLCLWTRPSALSNRELKETRKVKRELAKTVKITFTEAQDPIAALPDLRTRHRSYVESVYADFTREGLLIEILEVHDAVREIRRSVDPLTTDREWSPHLPGDRIALRGSGYKGEADVSELLWPPLSWQVMPKTMVQTDLHTIRVGDMVFCPMFVDIPPKDVKPFVDFFSRSMQTGAPWRMSFLVESGGASTMGTKRMAAALLAWTKAENDLIAKSLEELSQRELDGEATVRLRIAFTTWAPVGEEKKLRNNAARIARAVAGWGYADTREICGDNAAGFVSSALGVTSGSVATPAVAPLRDVLYMMPITRPASPWRHGAVLLRTPDGKLMPYQPGSSVQNTWNTLIFAPPGSGKSVLMATINNAMCLSPGLKRLPRMAIIDIGPSSAGLISLIRDALPSNLQYLVEHFRIRMSEEYAINPFDTQLGCRKPTPQERAFLVNFLSLLATPAENDRPYADMSSMIGHIVDEVYTELADGDRGRPRRFEPGVLPEITKVLDELNVQVDKNTTWWDVVDTLFSKGRVREAIVAQRMAVPTIQDAAGVARSDSIKNLFKVTERSEILPDIFSRMMSDAAKSFPIISQPTRFDLGNARIVAMDLDEVTKKGSDAANRQTAAMYLLARYVLAHDFALTDDNVRDMHPSYREYHAKRITEINEDVKLICYDEFHRTSTSKMVREQVTLDMREGRKWNTSVMLASQDASDFDPEMVRFATSTFIMGSGASPEVQRELQEKFGLTEAERGDLATRVQGAVGGVGPTFLAVFQTKRGKSTLLLNNTIGPVEMWAFSTTSEDVGVRKRLYKALGSREARRVLAMHYPRGAKEEVERRRQVAQAEKLFAGEADESAIEQIVSELIEFHHKEQKEALKSAA